jgi:hypothetical protein
MEVEAAVEMIVVANLQLLDNNTIDNNLQKK